MANEALINYLEPFGSEIITGALHVSDEHEMQKGVIYLHDGLIVYAKTDVYIDKIAIFMMMSWQNGSVKFLENEKLPYIRSSYEPHVLIYEYAKLEDLYPGIKELRSNLILSYLESESIMAPNGRSSEIPDLENYNLYLETELASHSAKSYMLKLGQSFIGTSKNCNIAVDHPTVSKFHCRIDLSHDAMVIRDLGTHNGTFLENKMIAKAFLAPGDTISLGELSFRINQVPKRKFARETADIKGFQANVFYSISQPDKYDVSCETDDFGTEAIHVKDSDVLVGR
ncbi:MAG: FHA domain-containing protein [Verrucomicrobiota bacterium]